MSCYFLFKRDELSQILDVSLYIVALLIILKVSRIFITGLFTKFTLAAFGSSMGLRETNYLSILSSIGNFFGPILGGASIRAIYLKKNYSFKYATFLATLYGFYLISFMVNSLLGLISLTYFYFYNGKVPGLFVIMFVFLGIYIVTSLMVLMPSALIRRVFTLFDFLPKKVLEVLKTMIDGWELIRGHKKLLIQLILLNVAVICIAIVETYILYGLFSSDFTFINIFLYTILGSLSVLISFTPGAIGIKEAVYLFSVNIVALTSAQVLQIAIIDRSATFLLLLATYILIKIFSIDKKIIRS
jgi:uncharacterized membrane protein YbhN (UPF0104 family)